MTVLNPGIHALPMLAILPILAALLCLVINSHTVKARVSVVISFIQLLFIALLITLILESGQNLRYSLGSWGAPLGIDLVVNGFSLVLLSISACIVFFLSIYSSAYFDNSDTAHRFWPLWWLLVCGLNVAFISADIFNIYVALEIIGLSAVALVALSKSHSALVAALRYALVGLLGSLMYLFGVALLYRSFGTLDLAQLAWQMSQVSQTNNMLLHYPAFILISIGLMLKTAILPMHFWLPTAHASAPAPVSALLSALVVKASLYLLIRFWLDVFGPVSNEITAFMLGIFGSCAILWGSIKAIQAQQLKLLVAYSTVAQLGYLFLFFPLVFISNSSHQMTELGLMAVSYLIASHAFAKAAMFLVAGNIKTLYGHDQINRLYGLSQYSPVTLLTFAIAGISLIGIPPSGGFIAKWLLLKTAIETSQWWWTIVILSGGLLAAVYVGRILNIAFSQTDTHELTNIKNNPASIYYSALSLAIIAIGLGFSAEWLLNILVQGDLHFFVSLKENIQ